MSLKFYTQKNTWHQTFLPKKYKTLYLNTDLFNQQTLRPKKVCDRSCDLKKYGGCKFSTIKKKHRASPSCILQVPPEEVRTGHGKPGKS